MPGRDEAGDHGTRSNGGPRGRTRSSAPMTIIGAEQFGQVQGLTGSASWNLDASRGAKLAIAMFAPRGASSFSVARSARARASFSTRWVLAIQP